MQKTIKLKKGLNINLQGAAEQIIAESNCELYALKPDDYHLISPKLAVAVGDKVKAGSCIFIDKKNERIKFTSPISGVIEEIERGEKRKLLAIKIKSDGAYTSENFSKGSADSFSKSEIIENLLVSGLWTMLRQRPYNVIANPDSKPKAVFISLFDSAPLAPEMDFVLKGSIELFQSGINFLNKISEAPVHLNYHKEKNKIANYSALKNVVLTEFSGPHPAGNVGVQIHHLNPINKGEIVWVIDPQSVVNIGRLFAEGKYSPTKVIALTGSEVLKPQYFKTLSGAKISSFLGGKIREGELRFISGNVLTGTKVCKEGYLGAYANQITVIPEGNHHEFFGWAMPGLNKFSFSRTFFSWLSVNKKYRLDTNINGGVRALVMTGEFEKVLPMDILPMQLIKACIAKDIDAMEKLGIYEVDEEDFALVEFIDTSKTEIQEIIREGLNSLYGEMN